MPARRARRLASLEQQTIELAAASVDEARAALGLPSDPTGERLRDAVYLTSIPEQLGDPGAAVPSQTNGFRFEVSSSTAPLPDWWSRAEGPLVYLTFGSVAAGAHLPYHPDRYRAAVEALATCPSVLGSCRCSARTSGPTEEPWRAPAPGSASTLTARRAACSVCRRRRRSSS